MEKRFLNQSFNKPVRILRIIDSKNERFQLGKAYKDRFEVHTCLTKPEIEILVIIDTDKLKEFIKVKSDTKPSTFCKTALGHHNVKEKHFMAEYFSDKQRLLDALKGYKKSHAKDHLTLYDLLKDAYQNI